MKRRSLFILLAAALAVMLSSLAVSAQQPRAVPSNDSFTSATAIKIGKNAKVPDIGAATNEIGEPVASCKGSAIPHSVWYTFSQPMGSVISLSTFGTLLVSPETNSFDTVLAIFEQTSPGVFTQRACSDDTNGTSAAQLIFSAAGGTTYYIAAGTFDSSPIFPESILKLNTRMLSTNFLLPNPEFETAVDGTDWKLKNADDDQTVCSNATYPANFGNCAFRFIGTPGLATKLTQTIAFPAFAPRKNAFVTNYFSFRVTDTAALGTAKIKFVINYSDGTLPSIRTVNLTGLASMSDYGYRQFALPLKSGKVASIKFLVKFASPTGGLMVDSLGAFYSADPATRSLLPVPQAPAAQ